MSTYNNHKSTATIIATTTAVAVAVAYYIYKIKNDNKNGNKKTKTKCPFSFNNNAAAAVTSYPDAAKAIATTVTDKDGSSSTTTTTVVIITNLTNPRSSIGMGLPNELSTKTINMIVATAPVVAPNMLDITKCFYGKVLPKHPGLLQWFNPAVRIITIHNFLPSFLSLYLMHVNDSIQINSIYFFFFKSKKYHSNLLFRIFSLSLPRLFIPYHRHRQINL